MRKRYEKFKEGPPVGHLIYAAGNEISLERIVRSSGTRIVTWTIDLDQAPNEVISTVTHIARQVNGDDLRNLFDRSQDHNEIYV